MEAEVDELDEFPASRSHFLSQNGGQIARHKEPRIPARAILAITSATTPAVGSVTVAECKRAWPDKTCRINNLARKQENGAP
jgi:hypothetical protein